MNDAIIVLNAGSSSLKFSMYRVVDRELGRVARGQVEGMGTSPRFQAKDGAGRVLAGIEIDSPARGFGHAEAFAHLAQWARQHFDDGLSLVAAGHRIVHGGLEFTEPTWIDADVLAKLQQLVPLMPLHQPHNLAVVKAVMQLRPGLPQVACFDTAFHRTKPKMADRFGLPDEMFQRGVRRWGFHGLSYEFIAGQLKQIAPEVARGRVIVAHLGNGASLCAMNNGQCVDTTMSFSALDGLPMGTRCGNLDPGVILFLLRQGWSIDRIEDLLYKRSGLLGISGLSNDMRVLLESETPRAAEAIEFFTYRIVREIGSLTSALGGLDALIFTGGIGENSPLVRQQVCQGLAWLGIELDRDANQRSDTRISPPGQKPSVWMIPTDEEIVIACHTLDLVLQRKQQDP